MKPRINVGVIGHSAHASLGLAASLARLAGATTIVGETPEPRFRLWRVRKEWPEGGYSCCEYNAPLPCSAADVAKAPSVVAWVAEGGFKLDEIYHPD